MATVDARWHPRAVAALVRLARSTAWTCLVAQQPLTDRVDLADADLLVAAGVLRHHGGGTYGVADPEVARLGDNPEALALMLSKELEEALGHLRRTQIGWPDDAEAMLVRGRASGVAADMFRSEWLDRMPSSKQALDSGPSRFLDVGVGVGAISARMCEIWPELTATGLDVSDFVLSLAEREVDHAGLSDRIELRSQDVCTLRDAQAFDLAWLPQMYLSLPQFETALHCVHRALRTDRWAVAPLGASPDAAAPFDRALLAHYVRLLGGEPIAVPEAVSRMTAAGFVNVTTWGEDQVFIAGRTPHEVPSG